jgi:ubiquitin-like protein Pup
MNNKDDGGKKDRVEAEKALGHADSFSDDVDRILDEIDEPLEEGAEDFVRSYVQKGGQGWSGFFTPEFYVGAAAAGILSGATYDIFKGVIRRITKALLQVPGRSHISPEEYEAMETAGYEAEVIKEAWKTASRLAKQENIQHSIDEATALHWALFTIELEHRALFKTPCD